MERASYLRADDNGISVISSSNWWTSFNDPILSDIIDKAMVNSPSIDIANAKIAQARSGLKAARTTSLPTIGATASAPYINLPSEILDPQSTENRTDINSANIGFDASWEIDLFGGNVRRLEAREARAQATETQLADAQTSLSSEIARLYIGLRARQEMANILQQQYEIDGQLLKYARHRQQQGVGTLQEAEQFIAQQAQSQSDIAQNETEITILKDQLALLSGLAPGALDTQLSDIKSIPMPPKEIAIGAPADLLRMRPDIRLAERNLAAANADIGASISDKFPKINFMGILGMGGDDVTDIFNPARLFGLALPRLNWNIFNGGRTAAQIEGKRSAYDEAEAQYRATILAALNDAENSLTRFGGKRISLARSLDTLSSAQRTANLEQMRANAGTIAQANALIAQRQKLRAALITSTAKADLSEAYVRVNKSIGLGWTPAPER
ncbi:hypothetical protein LPB140_03090 [Sphingorhabdus lutea]|uniref:Efflux transporter outer membrane subunit n=2 Tax=Sphingorhabdus lutea TaxID=1913578 RepID=A0A1L3JEG4_9SPHN|nr:hypothetical protein LPB140_03090 [Sphingorhabdus lutea]